MNDPPVLYQRAKASDMLQGMVDMAEMMELEIQKFHRFHPNVFVPDPAVDTFFNQIRSLRNYTYGLHSAVDQLRQRGL